MEYPIIFPRPLNLATKVCQLLYPCSTKSATQRFNSPTNSPTNSHLQLFKKDINRRLQPFSQGVSLFLSLSLGGPRFQHFVLVFRQKYYHVKVVVSHIEELPHHQFQVMFFFYFHFVSDFQACRHILNSSSSYYT